MTVVRGQTYTFVVEGGQDPDRPSRYHPFYITDDPEGGYEFKTPIEKSVSPKWSLKKENKINFDFSLIIYFEHFVENPNLCRSNLWSWRQSSIFSSGSSVRMGRRSQPNGRQVLLFRGISKDVETPLRGRWAGHHAIQAGSQHSRHCLLSGIVLVSFYRATWNYFIQFVYFQ